MNRELVVNREGGSLCVGHWARAGGIAVLAALTAACVPGYQAPEEVETRPPAVSYNYASDDGLMEANGKARAYCSQYASVPSLREPIVDNSDGTKTVTFECIKTGAATVAPAPPPPSTPAGYTYRSDTELLQSIGQADAYCAQTGQTASYSIVTNADGSKTLTYRCVPH